MENATESVANQIIGDARLEVGWRSGVVVRPLLPNGCLVAVLKQATCFLHHEADKALCEFRQTSRPIDIVGGESRLSFNASMACEMPHQAGKREGSAHLAAARNGD